MSLQLAAQHMASRGRGPDTALVHMAPQEVAGLQALAKAHGGTLTVNPDTGLPEAGFLKSILPMIIGAGITAATGGAAAPWMIGLGMGGVEAARTGSLQKGLMAGLGAYGGAGLAGGLMGAGAAGAGAGAGTGLTATGGVMGANPMVAQPMTFGAETLGTGVGAGSGVFVNPVPLTPSAEVAGALSEAPSLAQNLNLQAQQQAAQSAMNVTPQVATATPPPSGPPTFSQNLSQMGRGLENPAQFMTADNLKYGLAGLAPMLFQDPKPMAERPKDTPRDYDFSYNRVADPEAEYTGAYTGQRTYFNPTFTERKAAGGGLMDIGPIEALSDRNQAETLMANGGQMFAAGGITGSGNLNLNIPLDLGGGQGGYGGAGGSGSPFSGAGAATQSGFSGQNNAAGGGFGFGSSMMSGMGGTAENGFMSPGGLGGNAPGLVGGLGRFGAAMRAAGNLGGSPMGHALQPGTPEHDNYMKNRVAGVGGSFAAGGAIPSRGVSHLGDYSDGGRLLKGPGDGVSDSIPATIANKRPARLADGEFVVPARIVSEIGNGSTEAGARKLYAMMDRVQKARGKTTGKNRVAVNSRAEKMLPA